MRYYKEPEKVVDPNWTDLNYFLTALYKASFVSSVSEIIESIPKLELQKKQLVPIIY